MNIHQIQMAYDQHHDRILMRVSTNDEAEFRFWLTRRFVKRLWGLLRKMLEQDESCRELNAEARRALLGMQHETYVDEGNFGKAFKGGSQRLPLGAEPVLLTTAKGKSGAGGGQVLSLYPAKGPGIDIALNPRLLHMLGKLLRDAVARSDWDVRITLLSGGEPYSPATPAAPRTLN